MNNRIHRVLSNLMRTCVCALLGLPMTASTSGVLFDAAASLAMPEPLGDTTEVVVRPRDTLERAFRRLKLDRRDLAALMDLPQLGGALSTIKPGDRFTVIHQRGRVNAIKWRLNESQMLIAVRTGERFVANTVATPVEKQIVYAHGMIQTSLYAAASAASVRPETTLALANDIFGWDIDFTVDVQPGDRFSIIYEQRYRNGEYIGDGRILAAEFVNAGRRYRAIYYASPDGKYEGYFSPDGYHMRRRFLRAPVEYLWVSSHYNRTRRHPIQNTLRAHKGVDYAAAMGTPVKAVGDGRVFAIGSKRGYGNVVILDHGDEITTVYAHLSAFAPGIRKGRRVRQGSVIGYVGQSGAATGPHLHYEYRIGGIAINPHAVALPKAQVLPPQYRADFERRSRPLMANLDRAYGTTVAALTH